MVDDLLFPLVGFFGAGKGEGFSDGLFAFLAFCCEGKILKFQECKLALRGE